MRVFEELIPARDEPTDGRADDPPPVGPPIDAR
jgi:hypothetical protein